MSRYYNPVFGRFSNFDAEINKNLYCYCSNSPILYKDTCGFSKELSTDNICEFEGDDWGTNVSKLPVSVLVSVAIHVYDEGDWEYQKGPVTYKKIDCIGLILLAAKFHFTRAAFRKNGYNIGLGTTSAATNNRSFALRKTSSTNIANLRVGTILYCPSLTGAARGHVGVYIGYYDDGNGHIIKHAVIHCHGKGSEDDKAGISIVPFEGSRFDCAQGEYTEYNYLDYDMSYDDTVRKYKGFRYEEM